jgi:hypothetical protein
VRLRSIEIVHVDRAYVCGDDGIDWHRLFRRTDVRSMADGAGTVARASQLQLTARRP